MRGILCILNKIKQSNKLGIEMLQRTPIPKQPFLTMWLVWIVGVFLLFDVIFAEEAWSLGERFAIFLIVGMFSDIRSFHSKKFVMSELKKKVKNLLFYLYRDNLICMAIGITVEIFTLNTQLGVPLLLARDSAFLVFWFLTIPLALIYNPWWWGLYASNIFLGTWVYRWFLDAYVEISNKLTIQYLCLTIGAVLIAVVVSIFISYSRIKIYKAAVR